MSRDRPGITRPCLIEIAGVAGSGKSTLARDLCRGAGFSAAGFIHTRTPSHLIHVARALPRLTRILAADLAGGPHRLTWAEFKLLVYVTEWRRVLRRRSSHGRQVTLLDQGPIYALVRLKAEGKPVTTGRAFQRWWEEMLRTWARELSAIVWLDAPDGVLWHRINDRPQSHREKGASADVGREFIARYRRQFEQVLDRIELSGGPQVIRLDTDGTRPEDTAEAIRPILEDIARSRAGMTPHDGRAA